MKQDCKEIPEVGTADIKKFVKLMRVAEPRLRKIYASPEIESKIASEINSMVGRDIVNRADCGGDLVAVIVIVDVAAPAPG
ncbi:MAG: hypothetical protein JRJ03_08335 [Deltaproteobacteria bacterium]|nr:hypothetical protein [Deltaproteobacteria bacterium]